MNADILFLNLIEISRDLVSNIKYEVYYEMNYTLLITYTSNHIQDIMLPVLTKVSFVNIVHQWNLYNVDMRM